MTALAQDVRTACQDQPDLFHAYDQEAPAEKRWRETEAKAICAACPDAIRESCLAIAMTAEHGLSAGNRNGIYGGLNEKERADLDRAGKRGPNPTVECGTHTGYKRHIRNKQKPCDPCKDANTAYSQQYRTRQEKTA